MRLASGRRPHSDDAAERSRIIWGAALLLAALVIGVYAPVARYGFVEFDDPGFVSENPFVQGGLTADGIRWAFTTGHMWNWHPLTWLSYMLDVQVFGVDPGAHHVVSAAVHLANTLLVFALFQRTTRALWPSWVVAALFGIHPLHVESVAWISERKDVLSGLFFILTLWAYAAFVEARSPRWYAVALGCFALGLMAKTMLVTVPFVLLLVDVWPLGRVALRARTSAPWSRGARPAGTRRGRAGAAGAERGGRRPRPEALSTLDAVGSGADASSWSTLLWEKVPFLALTAAATVVTYLAGRSYGAMDEAGMLSPGMRVANALVAYVRYLAMTVWPANLAVFYPYDMNLAAWQVVGAALCLGAISVAVFAVLRTHPYAAVGWLWYLGMLVPVIGLVQVGSQALADRYTYLPLIGIFVVVAWGGQSLAARAGIPAAALAVGLAAVLGAYAVAARSQVGVWQNGETLLAHATRVTSENYLAHNNLGVALQAQGRIDAAIAQYREALRIKPDYVHARTNLGKALVGRYERVVAANPDDPVAQYELATALRDAGRHQEAIERFELAIRLEPDYAAAHRGLGGELVAADRLAEAAAHYREALRLAPADVPAHFNLGSTLARLGDLRGAVEQFQRVLELAPDDAEAWGNLAMAYAALDQPSEALRAQQKAVEVARSKRQWALVKTLEDWLGAYNASRVAVTPAG